MIRSFAARISFLALLVFLAPIHLSGSSIFQNAQAYNAGGANTFSVAVADVNRDGKPDLILASQCMIGGPCNYNQGDAGSVGVLLGNGDGTFQAAQTYYSGGGTAFSVAVADVNGDGKPDILVVNACVGLENCGSGVVGVLLGNGDGTFQPAKSYGSGGIQPFGIAVADVNGDGKPDVFVGNSCAIGNCGKSVVSLLLGNGDGTFQVAQNLDPGALDPEAMAVRDINGDGKPDLLIASFCIDYDDCDGALSVLVGNGDGTFQTAQTYDTGGFGGTSLWVADVSGDGKLDAVVTNTYVNGSDYSIGSVSVFLGNGDGSFKAPMTYSSGGFATDGVTVADVDGDSRPDILTSNSCRSAKYGSNCVSGVVGVLRGNGDGTFRAPLSFSSGGTQSKSLAVADFNNDGRPDVVIVNVCAGSGPCSYGTGGVIVNIGKYETTTTVVSNLNPAIYGQVVSLTASVTSIGPDVPTGRVTFKNGNTLLGSTSLAGGNATLTTSKFPAGILTITAAYSGYKASGKSTSTILSQQVKQASSATTITSSPNPSTEDQQVTLTAKVTSPTAKITGTVTFSAGTMTLGAVTIKAGKATLLTSGLPAGSISITAAYSGNADIAGSSASLLQTVN